MKNKPSSLNLTRRSFPNKMWHALYLVPLAVGGIAQASTDYGPAGWYPCCNYNTSGTGKRFYVEHDMEGYFWPSVFYLQKCTTQASIHYSCNGKKDTTSDAAGGYIVQQVRDAYYAWHVRCWNGYTMGTEHEGFASNPAWYTEALYQASAALTASKCNKYGIAKDRNHVIGHGQETVPGWVSWMQSIGYSYSFATCNSHTDPGPYWQWTHYMDLVRGGGAPPPAPSTPSAPSNLAAAAFSISQINLTWVDHSGIENGFKIERATASGGPFTQIATVGANVVSYSSTGLAAGTTYYYRVRAYNGTGDSPYSNTASAATKITVPAPPSNLAATTISDTQINLTWSDNSGIETGHRIYRSTDNVNFAKIVSVGANSTSYADMGVQANQTYWYRVTAVNTAGESAPSNTAQGSTGPKSPTSLTATAGSGDTWNQVTLRWTDNSGGLAGTKVERGTASGGPFTQIIALSPGTTTMTDTGLAASTTYYYRVRSYAGNANSGYSNVASAGTMNPPPVLGAIGNKTVSVGSPLTFTASSTDPNAPAPATTMIGTWEGSADGAAEVMFRKPFNSGSTSAFIDTALTNYSLVRTGAPAGVGGTKALKAGWTFKAGFANYWLRYTSGGAPSNPNPTIALDQTVQFRLWCNRTIRVGIGVRETGTTAAYGADGGVTGTIEWVGVTNVVSGVPFPSRQVNPSNWTTLTFNIPFDSQRAFTGDGKVDQSGAKGTLEEIAIYGAVGANTYITWLDDAAVIVNNNLTYSLDAGAPAGASIERRTGKFSWTPTAAQEGVATITVRVADAGGAQDFETIRVTVVGTGNAAPVLAAIGNKSVEEGIALAFTASATDYNVGQTLTYSLDAGAPAGAAISSATGAFSWTPTEAQGPGSYPITIRVTDNGSPAASDFETITVTVNEANSAPTIAAIANQTIDEGGTITATASATDSDTPVQTITYSVEGPAGLTINPTTGAISWTSDELDGGKVHPVKVRATDNGNPVKWSETTFTVTVNEVNTSPVLTVGTKTSSVLFAGFDELDDENVSGHNNAVLFRVPYFSASTTTFLDSTSYSYITNVIPQDGGNNSYQALYVSCNFKTGTTNPWLRLSTFTSATWTNTFAYPNPTIDLGQRVRFKIWCDKSIKVALGVRETGTSNPIGFEGGITGPIEWVGATLNGSSPNPSRVVNANSWTTLDFNLPAETITAFPGSGNGLLATGKGVLEHLAIVPNGGSGIYKIYLDDFETVSSTTSGTITIDTGNTVTIPSSATDADLPAQDITFGLAAGAPAGASIDPATGVFTWTPTAAQSPSTSVITIQATDNGSPAMTASQDVTIVVNKINTPPRLEKMQDQVIENTVGGTISFDASAEDDDLPGDTLTYSLVSAPAGATIDPGTGTFSWTPPAGLSTNVITIRVTDNGTPPLKDEQTVTIVVAPMNTAPTLSLGTARMEEPVVTYETFTNNTPNEAVMFKKPFFSSTTTSFVDTAVTNFTRVTTSFPAGNANAGAKVLRAEWSFKTGTANYWVRLTTANTTFVPNPTFNASARLKVDVYSTKALKVALGIRETGTTAENGANGGTTGTIEYVGASTKQANGCPNPTRTVNANVWTTLEFDLPNEPKVAFTGDGILNGGQQVLEHLALVGAGGTGVYTVYLDNFSVVTTAALPGTVAMKANSTLTFTASGTDPDPGAGLGFGIDADTADTTTATINNVTGAFTWTPTAATTQNITVSVDDSPTNGGLAKTASQTISVVVNADTLAPQDSASGTFVAGEASETLVFDSVPGSNYAVQYKGAAETNWVTVENVTANGSISSVSVTNTGNDGYYRIVEIGGADSQ